MENSQEAVKALGIKFKRSWLAKFDLVNKPGKYALQVLNNVSEKNLFTDEVGRKRYIVGLRALTTDTLAQLKEVFKDNVEEVEIEQTNGLFLTATIWKKDENDTPALPMKGEIVDVTIDFVENRDGAQVLRVTNISVKAAVKAEKLSLDSLNVVVEAPEEEHAGAIAH